MGFVYCEMKFLILAALLFYCCSGNPVGTSDLKAPRHSCTSYLTEGEDLTCECFASSSAHTCKTYWIGCPDGPRLQKLNVTREGNGTSFTCEMDCSGQTSSTNYTLQVAYGPQAGSVNILGPSLFLADGKQNMTLTCVHGEMNPAPSFQWRLVGGLHCANGDTENSCILQPQHFHDGKNVICSVTNKQTGTDVAADFTVKLNYPPPKEPLLSGYTEGTPLTSGDTLNCSVTGGNPPVSTIYLNCSDHAFPCQHLTTGDTRTTSCIVDFKEDKGDIEDIQCNCSAVWEPDPNMYAHVATDRVEIQSTGGGNGPSGQHGVGPAGVGTGSTGVTIGVSLAVLIVIAVVAIVVYVTRRRKRNTVEPNHKCNTEAHKMKHQKAEDCDDGTYERLSWSEQNTRRVGATPEQVYNHIDRTVSGHHTHTDIVVC